MGRVLTVLGVLLLLVGIAGTAWSFLGPLLNPMNSMFNPAADAVQSAIDGPKAEDLCEPGETIETVEGPSSRTVGGTWGRPVTIYCVDAEGSRREVTTDFVADLFGQTLQGMPAFLGGLGLSVCFSSLLVPGIILLVIGSVISRRRQSGVVMVGGIPDTQVSSRQANVLDMTHYSRQQSSPGGDLAAKLRQLEDARAKNLISAEEYERLRQQILDSMG
jgi:hypothetical protein